MATGVVIRLTNLPLAAGAIDIRHFFKGLTIPDGGVHIIGGEDGTAFILFSTDEDARQAMLQDSLQLCGAKIKLMLSSHSEMKTVIEQSQRMCEQLRGQRLLEPPITNLSNQSNLHNFQTKRPSPKKQLAPESLDANDVYMEIKGMPFSVNQTDIVYFFSPLNVSAIKFMLDEKGRKTGSGFIKFSSAIEKMHGLKRDRKFIGSRFVKLSSVSERQWLLANSLPSETVRLESEISINRKRQQSHTSDETIPKRSRELSPLKSDNCVEVSGLPSSVSFKDVGDFFTRLRFVDGGLYVEMDGSLCKGIAYVEFKSYTDYQLALKKDGDILNGKQVRVISLSKQIMLDKISRHKKYAKAKREELEKHKHNEKNLKQIEHQKKKDNHLRKQKEMDEWLRRQHEKEQNERKKSEIEKQKLQSSEEQKLLAQLLSDAKALDSLKQTGDFDLKKEIIRKLEELAGKSTNDKEESVNTDEPLLGAGEMELDEDNSNEQNLPTSSHIQQNVAVSSSVSFPFSGSGNSGSVVAPQLPINFNPPISFLNSFSFPNMPPIPSNVSNLSSHLLPVIAKPPFVTSQATAVNPPPLPPFAVPPPIPPVVGSLPATFPTAISNIPNPAAAVSTFHVPEIKPLEKATETIVDSEYVRVANSPFNVTEEEVRRFFVGLQIPEKGIQFISKLNGNRSGHIFIKFGSKSDAAKAVLKDDQNLGGRNVLVKAANIKTFNAIYEKLTKGGKYVSTFDEPQMQKSADDNIFTKRILDDKMTCVCIGNVPATATEEDIACILGDIKFFKSKIVLLCDPSGACKGDAYVEVESPSECVKAADLHGVAKIGEQIIRVLPLTLEAMEKDLQSRQRKPGYTNFITRSNGHTSEKNALTDQRKSFGNHQNPSSLLKHNDNVEHNMKLAPPPPHEILKNPLFDPALQHPPIGPADVFLPPTTDEFLRLSNPLGFPPVPPIPPPPITSNLFLNPPPLPLPPGRITALKMSNLSFKITREDIVEFFAGFDLLPDSIRLMYNNNGKPTGDGILAFSTFEGATSALENLNGKQFLGRKLKLMLQ